MNGSPAQSQPAVHIRLRDRPTPPHAFGVLPVWSMAFALAICLVMIVGLMGLILVQGATTFWPRPVERVELLSGQAVIGIPVREEADPAGGMRRLYRVGNRDLGGRPFEWVPVETIERIERPSDLVVLEREEWGIFIGTVRALQEPGVESADPGRPSMEELREAVKAGRERRRDMAALRGGPIAEMNARLGANRQALAAERMNLSHPRSPAVPRGLWMVSGVVSLLCAGLLAFGLLTRRLPSRGMILCFVLAAGCGLVAVLERPVSSEAERIERFEAARERLEAERAELLQTFAALTSELDRLDADDAQHRIVVESVDGRIAPASSSAPNEPMRVSQIVRLYPANDLSRAAKVSIYLDRWVEFLTHNPREANTEGGVFPVIIGTLVVTLLLTIAVVPLGVMAALYIREYAKQGPLVSILRIAINNLAGVPSIVYGVFGLGFFCYTVGGFIDGGPVYQLPKPTWWIVGVLALAAVGAALLLGAHAQARDTKGRIVIGTLWSASVLCVLVLVATSPYFDGLFRVKLLDGEPTFGSSGLLWASLTLALLTLPVVVVSTEEAIAAVPPSLREGSYGCGASRWQTIRRVVLPGAMPGVMTGAILAIARGAGEVAPLMVVGAVKLAPELPIGSEFPFVFADRSFMHLGFHIFDLGFQSPDSEAARGMVWTTTLLLIVLVVAMNLAAILLRARLRSRLGAGHF